MTEVAVEDRQCERCQSPLEVEDLRCAICGQAAPKQTQRTVQRVSIQILRCRGCGAALRYDPKHQAPACSFCGDVVRVESIDDPPEQTELYVPFSVDAQQARETLRRWLASRGWFCPSDLSSTAQLTQLKPLWWVAWIFDADAFVSWAADSNANSGRSAWAPHSGQNMIRFDDILISASRGLSYREVSVISPGMNLATAKEYPAGADESATIEQFDLQRSQARQQVSAAIDRLAANHVQSHFIPGTRFRNVKVSVVLRKLFTRRFALPAYVLAYRYKDRLYRVVICGQDASLVIGATPKSLLKMLAVAAIVLVIVMIVFAAIASGG